MASGKSAIALVFGAVNDPALEVVFHRESPQVALLSEKHPLARKQELCMADFAPYRLVLLNSSPHVIGSLERQCAAAGCAPQILLDGGAWGQALELVAKANYVSFCLPPKTMKEEKLVTRPVRDLDLTINFNMAVLRGAALSRRRERICGLCGAGDAAGGVNSPFRFLTIDFAIDAMRFVKNTK